MSVPTRPPYGPIHRDYNKTTLELFNYTIYDNGTLSNGTKCYLSFGEFHPILFDNGTFQNQTSCDYPLYAIKSRGAVGVAWAIILIVLLPVTLFCLRKHGKPYLEEKKQYRRFSRKWQWYWLIILQILGAVSGFFSIDLDRDYIQGTSLTSYSAIYCATLPVSLATTWELTRHWGSFEERKKEDDDPFIYAASYNKRTRAHWLMALAFYFSGFLNFLLTVLRNWNKLKGNDSSHAVDIRWKVGGVFAIIAWLIIILQIVLCRTYFRIWNLPLVIPAVLFWVLVLIAFNLSFMWNFPLSPFNVNSNIPYVAIMGYLPIIAIVVLMNLSGIVRDNEDRVIITLRRERDKAQMEEIMRNNKKQDTAASATTQQDKKENIYRIQDSEKTLSELSSSNSSSDDSMGKDSPKAKFAFFKFFGGRPTRNLFANNLRYLPFRGNDEEEVKTKSLWNKIKSSNGGFNHPLFRPAHHTNNNNDNATSRPPPRDIREKWKVKTVSGV